MCFPTSLTGLYKVFWIPVLLSEAPLLALVLVKWAKMIGRSDVQTSTANIMIRDSILFFFGYAQFENHVLAVLKQVCIHRTYPFLLLGQIIWAIGGVSNTNSSSNHENFQDKFCYTHLYTGTLH